MGGLLINMLGAVMTMAKGKPGLATAIGGAGYAGFQMLSNGGACAVNGGSSLDVVILAAALGAALMWGRK